MQNLTLRLSLLFGLVAIPAAAADIRLELPVACAIGKQCWVQQYPDHDLGPDAADYTCGSETYDGHGGTDIRALTPKETVPVVAAAAGVIKGRRDGMDDKLVRDDSDRTLVAGRECGNGVVITHDNGWETQYCHLRKGSVKVKTGDVVEAGTQLGEIGYSGDAGFPHVELTLRKDNEVIDPFGGPIASDCGAAHQSLWSDTAAKALAYVGGSLLQLQFTDREPTLLNVETGQMPLPAFDRTSSAIVTYAWLINLKMNDVVSIRLRDSNGELAHNDVTLDHNKAQYLLFAGKKKPDGGWAKGQYVASLTVTRATKVVLTHEEGIQID
jgi:hypothetical protein